MAEFLDRHTWAATIVMTGPASFLSGGGMRHRIRIILVAACFAIPAAVIPVAARAEQPEIVSVHIVDDRTLSFQVYSAAMDKPIRVDVLRPADRTRPHPTLYLLNGASGGYGGKSWQDRAPEVFDFLATKEVNVVQPIGGIASFYGDWRAPDPVLGVNKWKTFLTAELPPLIDKALGANGINAIAGVSGSATAVLNMAIAAPGLFRAVAAYSGCPQISDPIGHEFVRVVAEFVAGGNLDNMYGAPDNPLWAENDPYVHAEKLRGVGLYLYSGTGVPGGYDGYSDEFRTAADVVDHLIVDGVTEAATGFCTRNMVDRLLELGIPVTYDLPPDGGHAWQYWRDQLIKSWPVLAEGLDIEA
ncbi:alpha/beta hydrolase family protein [Nocardia sp. NPDC052001]|uniref:alpha/beta hydrolase n=1 Tax=Nocardia sp. NPDC052001 TaxID=3154853 RepID=UPI00342D3911